MEKRSALAQRAKPAGALGVGLSMLGLNVFLIAKTGHYMVLLLFGGSALTLAALFGTVVGEPSDYYGERPRWYSLGLVGCLVLGLLLALAVHIELKFG